ncbi:MAG: DUF3440 domain-containing protein [Clostridia bacterium]
MKKSVYELVQNRLDFIFKEFDNIYISFSGGKDSSVLLNLCIDYMRKKHIKRKIGVFHIDYEAQYQMTTDFVDQTFQKNQDILEFYRICLPLKAQCATSMYQSYWLPWNLEEKDIWVRNMPKNCINEENQQFNFYLKGMWDYDFQKQFGLWYHTYKKAKKTIDLIGIRSQESLNRWRSIYSDKSYKIYKNRNWIKPSYELQNVFNGYPIYDWRTEDIWVANAKFGWEYNKLYDLYYQAGLDINQMRVASPFNDCAIDTLKLYKAIDPNNWAKMVGRVNGANFSSIYGGTSATGWKSITLPPNYTWEKYMYFLLDTLPEKTKQVYLQKLNTSIKFWREKGGVLSEETIQKLKSRGINVEVVPKTNYHTNKKPVKMEYLDSIDIPEFKEIPTYKRMCICIMKNDHLCKYMGFSQTKEEILKRKESIKKWKNLI